MQITPSARGSWTILALDGKVDNAGSDILKAALLPLLSAGPASVALDFAKVEYVTSSGFRVLLLAEKEQRKHGGRLLVAHLSPTLRNFFEIAGLHTVLHLVPDLDAALATEA
jgi:anti-sigma B factor antagonist